MTITDLASNVFNSRIDRVDIVDRIKLNNRKMIQLVKDEIHSDILFVHLSL
jgi:hypothetical protein